MHAVFGTTFDGNGHNCVDVMQAQHLVLGQPGIGADSGAGLGTGLCHFPGRLLPTHHHAHGSGDWSHHPCTLSAIRGHAVTASTGQLS